MDVDENLVIISADGSLLVAPDIQISLLRQELARKVFHLLSLFYGILYLLLGWHGSVLFMTLWVILLAFVEIARLKNKTVRLWLEGYFDGIIRPTEKNSFSGAIHTALGVLSALWIVGDDAALIITIVLQLAFSDLAAAIVGKAFGRIKIAQSQKTIEGSCACLTIAFISALVCGLSLKQALFSSVVVTLTEALPTTSWFNDNFWIPTASGVVLKCLV